MLISEEIKIQLEEIPEDVANDRHKFCTWAKEIVTQYKSCVWSEMVGITMSDGRLCTAMMDDYLFEDGSSIMLPAVEQPA